MTRSRAPFSTSSFFSKNRDVVVFVIIITVSLAILVARVPSSGHASFIVPLQKGLTVFANRVQNIGFNAERIEQLNYQYEELVSNLDIYQYATRISEQQQQIIKQLNENLEFSSSLEFDNIIAQVIARDPNRIFDTFVINKGENHGIGTDMPVVAVQDGLIGLVGRIISVSDDSAVIQSIIDEESFIITDHPKTQLVGIMNGAAMNNSIITLDFVDARGIENIKEGDIVVSSRFSSVYPPSIPIGVVRPFQKEQSVDNATIEILPLLNFNRLNYVFVLLPSNVFVDLTQ